MADSLNQLKDAVETRLLRAIVDTAEDLLEEAGPEIGAIAVSRYMRDAGKAAGRGDTTLGPNRTDTLRIVTGRLSRSLTGARTDRGAPESINRVRRIEDTAVQLVKGSKVPYAEVHERGFQGAVDVRPHRRTMKQGFGPDSLYPMEVVVGRHTRQMDIPARPFLSPAVEDYRPQLQEKAAEEIRKTIREVLRI